MLTASPDNENQESFTLATYLNAEAEQFWRYLEHGPGPFDTLKGTASAVGTRNEARLQDGTPYPRGRDKQFYGLTVSVLQPDLYLGLASVYEPPSGLMWIELVHSYDGINWIREPNREPFIDRGSEESWDTGICRRRFEMTGVVF